MIFNQLQILKEQGLVNKIGVSAYIDSQLIKIIDRFDIDIIQFPMNIYQVQVHPTFHKPTNKTPLYQY